jgi:hypothetical protein
MPKAPPKTGSGNRYQTLLEKIFFNHFKKGDVEVPFDREEFVDAAKALKIVLPKNIGDVIYSVRYRTPMPSRILATQPKAQEWIIDGVGKARYIFRLTKVTRIVPNANLVTIKIPDATPEIISAYKLSDEQALLAIVRYNRLIDMFLGIAAYSLQSHLRTSVKEIGQIEIDEVYVGVGRSGRQFIVPVQAKGGNDKIGATQAKQDIVYCKTEFPDLICRAISAQFMKDNLIALFELVLEEDVIKIVDEAHYQLVPSDQIAAADLASYRVRKK